MVSLGVTVSITVDPSKLTVTTEGPSLDEGASVVELSEELESVVDVVDVELVEESVLLDVLEGIVDVVVDVDDDVVVVGSSEEVVSVREEDVDVLEVSTELEVGSSLVDVEVFAIIIDVEVVVSAVSSDVVNVSTLKLVVDSV